MVKSVLVQERDSPDGVSLETIWPLLFGLKQSQLTMQTTEWIADRTYVGVDGGGCSLRWEFFFFFFWISSESGVRFVLFPNWRFGH